MLVGVEILEISNPAIYNNPNNSASHKLRPSKEAEYIEWVHVLLVLWITVGTAVYSGINTLAPTPPSRMSKTLIINRLRTYNHRH